MNTSATNKEAVMSRRFFLLATSGLVAILLLSVSCSGGKSPTAPAEMDPATTAQSSAATCLGAFRIIPGDDLTTAEILPVRIPQFDVTQWAKVKILETEWDPVLRNWTLTVEVTNPTFFYGFGVQAIFTELGEKELRWPDGFLWLDLVNPPGDERYPFFAIEKNTFQRVFPPYHTCIQDLTFHFPQGVEKWIPIEFFIDAHLQVPRPNPMVEDMATAQFPPPCQHASVLAHIQDHQSDGSELDVWVDLSPVGGSDHEPLYDDGNHDDGDPGDGVFGAEFTGGTFGELYTLTVYASDPESNTAENETLYSPISYPPLPPIAFETMFQDIICMLTEETLVVIKDSETWDEFWAEFTPWDMPPPTIPFDELMVIAVCIGTRPDDCYSVEIDNINWSGENCGWAVNYTETVPGPDCKCNDVPTSPFHLVTVNKSDFDIMFVKDIYEDPCTDPSDPCIDLFDVASGQFCNSMEQTMSVIYDQDEWSNWWISNIGSTPPVVDFDTYMVFAITMGGTNSSGHYPTVDSACIDLTEMLEITLGWHHPGADCITLPVMSSPYVVYKGEKVGNPYYWTTYTDIYPC